MLRTPSPDRGGYSFQAGQPVVLDVRGNGDVMSSADHESTRHGAYVPRVGAVVSVVTQEEITVRRYRERPEAALGRNLGKELDGAFTSFDPLGHPDAPGHTVTRIDGLRDFVRRLVLCGGAVDVEHLFSQFHGVPGQSHQTLDQA